MCSSCGRPLSHRAGRLSTNALRSLQLVRLQDLKSIPAPRPMARVSLPRLPTFMLLPSPPTSPLPSRSPSPPPDGFLQLSLKGVVQSYVPPCHKLGEEFPGKQSPTTQLSLFEAGVKKVTPSVSSRRS